MTSEAEQTLENALYVVATPIGNLGDITMRAIETLKSATVVAAEDTRVTRVLLNHFAIKTRLIAVHEHNERNAADGIVNLLQQGQSVALVTDGSHIFICPLTLTLISSSRAPLAALSCDDPTQILAI